MDFDFKKTMEGLKNDDNKEAGYNNNIPSKTEAEVFTVSVLVEKINATNEAIKKIGENFSEKGTEISQDSKDLIKSLEDKVRIYTMKLAELQNK